MHLCTLNQAKNTEWLYIYPIIYDEIPKNASIIGKIKCHFKD